MMLKNRTSFQTKNYKVILNLIQDLPYKLFCKKQFNNKNQRLTGKIPNQVWNDFYNTTARGFTLIELLVVVLIIGILAAVALPQYQLAVAKSRFIQLQTAGDAFIKAYKAYYLANGQDPTTFDQLDFLPFNGTLYDSKTRISNGNLSCRFNGTAEVACSSGEQYWIYGFPTIPNVSVQDKKICRAYNELNEKVCLSLGGTLRQQTGTSYKDYFLP